MDKTEFDSALEHFQDELRQLHAGRPNPALIEDVQVEAYDSMMRLQEVASITVPEPQQLLVEPWDKTLVKSIESGLRNSGKDLNPVVDGESLRISFPPLTEEKRKDMVKVVNQKAEESRVVVRRIREDLMKDVKAQEKAGDISEDDLAREQKEIQAVVDEYTGKIKELAEKKEAELLKV